MKYIKYTLLLFVLSFALSAINAKAADGYRFIHNINLPKLWGEVEIGGTDKTRKTKVSYQYYENYYTSAHKVEARTYSVEYSNSKRIGVAVDSSNTWGENVNMYTGDYSIKLRNSSFTVSGVTYGTWFLHEDYYLETR